MKHSTAVLIRAAFPTEPLPASFFREDADVEEGDIPYQLQAHFLSKKWNEVSLLDWISTAPIGSIVTYLTADTFRYYTPSILIGSLEDVRYLDWGIEAVLPHNQRLEPRGEWWKTFFGGFTSTQRIAIREFLKVALSLSFEGSACEFAARHGLEQIWVNLEGH